MVVEDDAANRFLFQQVLELRGFDVVCAVNGYDGVKMALSCRPALILLDIALPDISGVEVLKLIRNQQETKDIPVVATTAFAMNHDYDRFLTEGFSGYISKPIDVGQANEPKNLSKRLGLCVNRRPAILIYRIKSAPDVSGTFAREPAGVPRQK